MISLLLETSTNNGFLDSLIGATIILLILSLITEKFAQFIKEKSPEPEEFTRLKMIKHINAKPYKDNKHDEELEMLKKRDISSLAIFIGIMVALATRANFFELITEDNPQEVLFWGYGGSIFKEGASSLANLGHFLYFLLGACITGFFLSFGSTFFHDLLDTLYQTKEYKRKLRLGTLNNIQSIQGLKKYLQTGSYQLASQALSKHQQALKQKYPGIIQHLDLGLMANDQIGIIASLSNDPPADFPHSLPVELADGASIQVVIETMVNEAGDAQFGLECRLQNMNQPGESGSFGGVVVSSNLDRQKYALTCSHVALGGKSINLGGKVQNEELIELMQFNNRISIGSLSYARRDALFDTALIKIEDDDISNWDNLVPGDGTFKPAIPVEQLTLGQKVFFYSSRLGKKVSGKIERLPSDFEVTVFFDDLKRQKYSGIICIGKNEGGFWGRISEKGDSGSVLFTENYEPFGMIIAGGKLTYALPLKPILEETKTHIFNS